MALKFVFVVAVAALAAAAPALAAAQSPAPPSPPAPVANGADVNAAGAAIKAYQDRLKEYVAFHKRVEATVPKLDETADSTKIAGREKALGDALMKAREGAKPGEFFIKEVQPYLEKTIRADFAKRPLADRKALIVELPKNVTVGFNMIYPTTLPLATFPPKLLGALPDLPPELEYRIVGRHLILRDVKGNYIVDLMTDVFPIPR